MQTRNFVSLVLHFFQSPHAVKQRAEAREIVYFDLSYDLVTKT